jgi:molecular chaperone DnaK
MVKIIEKNTTIPFRKTRDDFARQPDQTTIVIPVFQGERAMAADNRLLGEFNMGNLPAGGRGMMQPQIEVTFDIDANGILKVTAKDKTSGKEADIRIERSSDLSKDDIERMRREAELNADTDKKKLELAQAKDHADRSIRDVEKLMAASGDKLTDADKAPINSAIEKVRQTMQGDDPQAIRQAMSDLQAAAQALARFASQDGEAGSPTGDISAPAEIS